MSHIPHWQSIIELCPSSLNVCFEIELNILDLNMVSELRSSQAIVTELRSRAKTFKIWAFVPLSRDWAIELWSNQAKQRSVIKQRFEPSHQASEPRSKLFILCSRLSLFEAQLNLSSSYTLSLRGNIKNNNMNQGIHMRFNEHESMS